MGFWTKKQSSGSEGQTDSRATANNICIYTKLKTYRAVVNPSLLHGFESWTLYWWHIKQLEKCHMCPLYSILGILLAGPCLQHWYPGLHEIYQHSVPECQSPDAVGGHFVLCQLLPDILETEKRTWGCPCKHWKRHCEGNPMPPWHPEKDGRSCGCWQNPLANCVLQSNHWIWRQALTKADKKTMTGIIEGYS